MEKQRKPRKKSRVNFDRLMCHAGYTFTVLAIWTTALLVSKFLYRFFWG